VSKGHPYLCRPPSNRAMRRIVVLAAVLPFALGEEDHFCDGKNRRQHTVITDKSRDERVSPTT
jgi:hypothetical protein